MKYVDPALTIDQQVNHLLQKGLQDQNIAQLRNCLISIGFFRLNKYMKYFVTNGKFNDEISISRIEGLYNYDKYLRSMLLNSLADIETAVKSSINNMMSTKFGAHWYMDNTLFKSGFQNFHRSIIQEVAEYCNGKPEEPFIRGYKFRYTQPELPPCWMIMEILSFGKVSLLYESISATEQRIAISESFKTHDNILTSWLRSLSYVRNLCAHHALILDRSLTIKPLMPSRKANVFLKEAASLDNSKIYAVCCCIQKLLTGIGKGLHFKDDILYFAEEYNDVPLFQIGFTENWREEVIWSC